MSASCFLDLEFKGTEEQFQPLWELLHKIEGTDTSASEGVVPMYKREKNKVSTSNVKAHKIWGDDFLEPKADLYLLMAKVAKDLEFSSHSERLYEGGGEGCSAFDEVSYKNGTLVFRNQSGVDELMIDEFLTRMLESGFDKDYDCEHVFMIAGEMYVASRSVLEQYIADTENELSDELTDDVEYLIVNEREKYEDLIAEAEELGVKVISEVEFYGTFSEIYDIEEEFEVPVCENEDIIQNLKMEDLKACCKFSKDITEEDFENFKNGCIGFVVDTNNNVSKDSCWNKMVYIITEDGTIYDADGTENKKMTKAVQKLEKKYLGK